MALPAGVAEDPLEEGAAKITPAFGSRLRPVGQPLLNSAQDGSTLYLNTLGPPRFSPPAGQPILLGEPISLSPNPPAPLEIRVMAIAVAVNADTPLYVHVRIWDTYNGAMNPVHSGLLRTDVINLGFVLANAPGQYYPDVDFGLSSPVELSDPDIFVDVALRTGPNPSDPYAPCSLVLAQNPSGPQVGTSSNLFYRDVDPPADGTFAPSDARVVTGSLCSPDPPGCQANLYLHIKGAPNPNLIDPGMDIWETPANGATHEEFPPASPIPGGFFDACAPGGSHSDPFSGTIVFHGVPLDTMPQEALWGTDTIVRRLAAAHLPSPGSSDTVPIQIVGLSLASQSPIIVTYDGGANPEAWNVRAFLSRLQPQAQGTMTITKSPCDSEGGTFTSTLPVTPVLVFRRSSDSCTVLLDPAPAAQIVTSNGHWRRTPPLSLRLVDELLGGVGVDGNGDGTIDQDPLPSTSAFHPGVRLLKCANDACAQPAPPVIRLTNGVAPLASHGMLPTDQEPSDQDLDFVPDIGDNCAPPQQGFSNPLQQDADDDGLGDVCDNCPNACNTSQSDFDNDGQGDACDPDDDNDGVADVQDCAPLDPVTFAVPSEVSSLTLHRLTAPPPPHVSLQWSAAVGGAGTVYDVVRGRLGALPVGPGSGDEVCHDNNVPGTTATDSDPDPLPGQGYWYDVRGKNICGSGTYGFRTNPPAERITTTCP